MKKYIRYWPIAAIIVICLFLIFSGAIDSCSRKKTTQVVGSVNTSVIRDQIMDSVNSVQNKQRMAAIDSVNEIAQAKVSNLNGKIVLLKSKLSAQEVDYLEDSSVQTPTCDSIIKTSNALIDSLGSQVNDYSLLNRNLLDKIKIQNSQNSETLDHLQNAYLNIDQLSKQLKVQTDWWHRNQKWVYFGGGIILTGLLLK
jgi:hypothetical protein